MVFLYKKLYISPCSFFVKAFAAVPKVIEQGIIILPFGKHKMGENIVSAMIAALIQIAEKEYICVIVLRKRREINKLYVHEVTLKEKLLDVYNQEVEPISLIGSSNPTPSLDTNQGDIAKCTTKYFIYQINSLNYILILFSLLFRKKSDFTTRLV